MTNARLRELLSKAVEPNALRPAGLYTQPASWGVYRIAPPAAVATREYRFGNHPVRQLELQREFDSVRVLVHFTSRAVAAELAGLYNAGFSE